MAERSVFDNAESGPTVNADFRPELDGEARLYLVQSGGTVTGIPQYGQIAPAAKGKIEQEAIRRNNEIHGTTGPDLPTSGTTQEAINRSKIGAAAKLRGDRTRAGNAAELQQPSMHFSEITASTFGGPLVGITLDRLVNPPGPELANRDMSARIVSGAGRYVRGAFVAGGMYTIDSILSSNAEVAGNRARAQFFAPSSLEITAMGATMAAPVPKFVPGANGNLFARVGARFLWEGATWLGTKGLTYEIREYSDPVLERANLDNAKQAQNSDHTTRTPDSMNAAIDGWKKLGIHNNQIQQVIDDTISQIGTTDTAKLAETRRDLAALYAAYGEARLNMGTRVGGPSLNGTPIPGPDKQHYIFEGKDFDFGGMAMYNLNTARNLLHELGIPASDAVAKRVYSSLSESDMSRILNSHSSLNDVYGELRTMVRNGSSDAQWLSAWLPTRVQEQEKLWETEQAAARNARASGQPPVAQYNNYVLAKVYQDQALLAMAYAAEGKDRDANLRLAHDALNRAAEIGWDGREIKVNGVPQRRQSDLPQLQQYLKDLERHG
jgi:hypothetical protein